MTTINKELSLNINSSEKLKSFLIKNSNLPGPRVNIELGFLLSEMYKDENELAKWLNIDESQAGTNDPMSYLPFCALICYGRIYTEKKDSKIINKIKKAANDPRWRVREACAFAFQIIGEHNFDVLKKIFSEWLLEANNLEKRCILVSLAHPKMLNTTRANYCLQVCDIILQHLDKSSPNFPVLNKALEFTISVFVSKDVDTGSVFLEKWIKEKNKLINGIMKKNLSKNRIRKLNNNNINSLLKMIT
jgi:protein required for attachment to host cells